MTYRRRPMLHPSVSPAAAFAIAIEVGPQLDALVGRLSMSPHPPNQRMAREVRAALGQLQEAGRAWDERGRWDGAAGSDSGTTEPPQGGAHAGSERALLLGHNGGGPAAVSAQWVAARWQVADSYVRRLCRNQTLAATRTGAGGTWVIDTASVARFEKTRSRR